jgi:sugar/nucleoside kinase (ribokinase family)
VLGGSVSFAALAAQRLGWQAGVLTSAGGDFEAARELPGVAAFVRPSAATTRFVNAYEDDGTRRQTVPARADDLDLALLPDAWRDPEVLLLGAVAGELRAGAARGFEAQVVGAIAQGFVRALDAAGHVSVRDWQTPGADLDGVHVLFLSEHDLPEAATRAVELLRHVPIVALTRGWRGLTLYTRSSHHDVPTLPRPEVDPTGAGDVFAAAFLMRYHETGDPLAAAAFGACAASCVVEGVGASRLGDRAEIERRLEQRERWLEDGEWEE